MIEGQFSRTALMVAGLRAAHQVADGATILRDPFAGPLLGAELGGHLASACDPVLRPLRDFVALRSRIAEDVAVAAIGQGVRQVVVLGAGLDTFALRLVAPEGLRVFEVDHPATQAEKRRRLSEASIAAPSHLVFAACDFEAEDWPRSLADAGFDFAQRAAFIWLGVVSYLTPDTVERTLRYVGELAGGADIVFDYANPPSTIESTGQRLFHERVAAHVASVGERFQCYFDTTNLHRLLQTIGFEGLDDWGPQRIVASSRPDASPPSESGGHIVHAFRRQK